MMSEKTGSSKPIPDWADMKAKFPENIPEFFVDGYEGLINKDGVIRINFAQIRVADYEEGSVEKQIVVRLAMPIGSLVAVHQALGGYLKENKLIEE